MDPLISVIIPVFKVEEYLVRCLDSVVGQTYRNLEIILVDDGSPDSCGMICDQYAKKDSRILVIHKQNGGPSSARNTGLQVMTGEYLIFVDSDDWMQIDAVRKLYDRILYDGSDMAAGKITRVHENGSMEAETCDWTQDVTVSGNEALSMLATRKTIPCYAWGKLCRRNLFDGLRFPDICSAEDVWVLPHILERCKTISYVSETVYFYYQHSSSIVHSSKDPQHLDSISASLHAARFLYDRGMITNAAGFYFSGWSEGKQVKAHEQAKALLCNSFTEKERRLFMTKALYHWRFFLPKRIYTSMRKIKRVCMTYMLNQPH